jgi:hypothetical protein
MMAETSTTGEKNNKIIYVLCHEYTVNEGDPDLEETNLKELFFSFDKQLCEAQIPFYKNLPGYIDFPDGFEVLQIALETHYFESGFDIW